MITAFTARPIVELKQRDKSKIDSLATHGDRILVGLNTGSLRVYRINDASNAKLVDLLRQEEKFSRYRLEQLAIIKEAKLLVSLSNGLVALHDLVSYEPQEVLPKSRGASAFAVTSNIVKDQGIPTIVSRLAVAVKRRLLVWSWQDSELAMEPQELILVTSIKTLMWATGTRLVVGLSNSYVLVDVEGAIVTDIVGPGSIGGGPGQDMGRFGGVGVASMGYMGMGGMIPKPLATKLGDSDILLAKDINTHFMDNDGKSLGRRQIPWALAPEAIGYSYPFLLSLQAARGMLEVRNPETLTALQTIALPSAIHIHVPPPNVSLAHAGKGFLVSSDRCIWRMDSAAYDIQVETLLKESQYEEAISLLNLLEDALLRNKFGTLREAKILKAQALFDMRKYRESLDEFRRAPASPRRVIALYPRSISGGLPYLHEEDEERLAQREPPDQKDGDAPFGRTNAEGKDSREPSTMSPNSVQSNRRHDRREGSGSQWQRGDDKQSDVASTLTSDAVQQRDLGTHVSLVQYERFADIIEEGKDLKAATLELASFLVESRTKLQRFLSFDGDLKTELDSLKQDSENHALISELFNITPPVDDRLVGRVQKLARLVDTTLFRAYMLASPSMAGPLFRLPNFCDPDVVKGSLLDSKRYSDLVDFFYGKRLHAEALDLLASLGRAEAVEGCPQQLRGPQRTVAYLQNLGPDMIDVILKYSEWPIETDSKLGMEVFVADSENAETLPRHTVLQFLRRYGDTIVISYLEHIIQELNDGSPEFHQELVERYLDKLKFVEPGDAKAELQDKTLQFLKTSRHYEAWKVLRTLSQDDPAFFEIRAVILGSMGEHRQALSILVFNMDTPEKAEEYCNQVYMKQIATIPIKAQPSAVHPVEDGSPSIYQTLLSIYLSPPPLHAPQWGPALGILTKHGSRLPASSSLTLIPESLPIQKLEAYFTTRVRAGYTILNEARVVVGLRKSVELEEDARLRLGEGRTGGHLGRNRNVLITEDRVCGVCHKRFGGSAIKVLPKLVSCLLDVW